MTLSMDGLTPKKIVEELDKYIIGQEKAKKSVSIALRNRERRRKLDEELREEIAPKNILMIGPTGVGKTEIARRLSRLYNAPFIKIEATKFTEVGYVGRDVESMVRDLVNVSINMVRKEMRIIMEEKARDIVEEHIVNLLVRSSRSKKLKTERDFKDRKEIIRQKLQAGELEKRMISIKVKESSYPMIEVFSSTGIEDIDLSFKDFVNTMIPPKSKTRKATVAEARKILLDEEIEKMIDMEKLTNDALKKAEEMGIIFLDEIDKIAHKNSGAGPDISREGVQRDILPIIEGSAVNTRFGVVHTDHILFIAAGAFNMSSPSDLIPELQGRFPIRVELEPLSKDDLKNILTQPKNALIKQYQALLKTEGVDLQFNKTAIDEIAEIAYNVNLNTENIGARRLHTIMEILLEDISFNAPELEKKKVVISKRNVENSLKNIIEDRDLSRYIL